MNKAELLAELIAASIGVEEGTTNKEMAKMLTKARKDNPLQEVNPPVEPKEEKEEEMAAPTQHDGDEPVDQVPEAQTESVDPASKKETNVTESLVATPKGVMRRVVKVIDEIVVKDTKVKGFAVFTGDGEFVRIYTPEDHKKAAQNLAKQFAKKIGGNVVAN